MGILGFTKYVKKLLTYYFQYVKNLLTYFFKYVKNLLTYCQYVNKAGA